MDTRCRSNVAALRENSNRADPSQKNKIKQVQNNSPYTISSCKLCKSTNTGLIEHTSGERKFRTFPTAVQPFFFTTVIVFAPAVAFTASVLATYTAFIFGTNATRKATKCNSFHYCAASHSAVNCLIVC